MRLLVVSLLAVACHLPVVNGDEDPLFDAPLGDETPCESTVEIPYDGVDQDCDGHDVVDVDGDGYASTLAGGPDCDDGDASVRPDVADELYDGIDQDCDCGDDFDDDGDGWMISGLPDAFLTFAFDNAVRCQLGFAVEGDVQDILDYYDDHSGDCNEWDASVHPAAEEREDDGRDHNCNGFDDF